MANTGPPTVSTAPAHSCFSSGRVSAKSLRGRDRIGAQLAKVIVCRFPARYGRHPVAKGFEQHHGGAADPAAGAGDRGYPRYQG
ncbi:hypothetical protein IE989_20100 [Klebsiella pneumoniae]|nr:hypothetical protein [Klebsiella pneumoniae]